MQTLSYTSLLFSLADGLFIGVMVLGILGTRTIWGHSRRLTNTTRPVKLVPMEWQSGTAMILAALLSAAVTPSTVSLMWTKALAWELLALITTSH